MNADLRFVLVVLASLALVGCSVNGDMTPMPDGPQTVKTVAFAGDTLVIPRPLLKIEVSGSWRNSDAAYIVVRFRNDGAATLDLPLSSSELVDPTETRWKLRLNRRNGQSVAPRLGDDLLAIRPGQEAIYDLVFRSDKSESLVGRVVELRLALDGGPPVVCKLRFDKSHQGWFGR